MNRQITWNVSSSPHVRAPLTTGLAMYDVLLALMPAAFFGVWRFGEHALLVLLMSVTAAVSAEFIFDYVTGKDNTVTDGSAVVTGLLLGLCLPSTVPLYVPYVGGLFAIVIVKGLFGGLGKNIVNPALAGRVFLLLSFGSAMTTYGADAVTGATPLARLAAGDAVSMLQVWTGHGGGVIGCSAFALLFGGLYLWAVDGITWHIPVSLIGSFTLFMALFGGQGFDPIFLLTHIGGGGVIMASFFMATDPVTSPVSGTAQLIYGALAGILSGLFRVYGGSADSVSYAVLLANLATPALDIWIVPRPYAYRRQSARSHLPHPVSVVVLAAAIFTVLLAGIYAGTGSLRSSREMAADMGTYQAALGVDSLSASLDDTAQAMLTDLDGGVYGGDFGNVVINSYVAAVDAAGNPLGSVVSVTSNDGRDNPITLSVGVTPDGKVAGLVYASLEETPGIGMKVEDASFTGQFIGLDHVALGENADAVSGATISSTAVANAVSAALDFSAAVREG